MMYEISNKIRCCNIALVFYYSLIPGNGVKPAILKPFSILIQVLVFEMY